VFTNAYLEMEYQFLPIFPSIHPTNVWALQNQQNSDSRCGNTINEEAQSQPIEAESREDIECVECVKLKLNNAHLKCR
jgi:hypothetical protein